MMPHRKCVLAGAALLCVCALSAQEMEEGGIFDTPAPTFEDVLPKSKKEADLKFQKPQGCDSFGFDFVMNFPGVIQIQFDFNDYRFVKRITMRPVAQTFKRLQSDAEMLGRTKVEISAPEDVFQNHMMTINDLKERGDVITCYALPNFWRYDPVYVNKTMLHWEDTIPDAVHRKWRIDFRETKDGIAMLVDGVFVGVLPEGKDIKSIRITGGTGPSIDKAGFYKETQSTPEWEVPNFPLIANSGVMKDAVPSIKPGLTTVDGIPMYVADGKHSSDMSLVIARRGMNFTAEYDAYMSRSGWERLPDSQQGSVPAAYYSNAYVLFALDPDPAKDRAFTFRLGRFCDCGRSTGFSVTDVALPAKEEDFPENIRKVGTVSLNGKNLPLYLAKLDLATGDIMDILTNDPHCRGKYHLDYDLFGRRSGGGAYSDGSFRPAGWLKSAVNIFGITLRRAGVFMNLEQSQPGNIFANDEVPETTMVLSCVRPGTYTVRWTISDVDGNFIRQEKTDVVLAKEGETKKIKIPLAMPENGHYHLLFEILNGKETPLVHHAMFALMGKDTRKALPSESPFGSWWHGGAHHGTSNPDIALKIFNKAGIRSTSGVGGYRKDSPEMEKAREYKITLSQFTWNQPKCDPDDTEAYEKALSEIYDPMIEAFPETKYITIFHESFGDNMEPEVKGIRGTATEKDKIYTKTALAFAKWFRKKHPDIKLCYGNNSSSSALTAALLRNNFDQKYLDFIGIEAVGQGCIPERLWFGGLQGIWYAKEVGRTWGRDLRVTGCFEFTARPDRLFDTERELAEYYMRDALIGLSYGFETLGIGGLSDVSGWYSQTVWGQGGLCVRNPLLYPKPFYVAYGTMTKVLDRIEFQPKTLNTGAPTTAALEFKRKGGDYAYAFWLPKGKGEIRFDFPENVEVESVEFFGRTKTLKGKSFTLPVSTSPAYLISKIPASSVKHVRMFSPEEPKNFQVAAPLDDLSRLRVCPGTNALQDSSVQLQPGKFAVREVNDEERGKCIEVELLREGKVPDITSEYTRIEFKEPIPLAGTPDELGIWVKGDAGWGKIGFEFQDARGYLYFNEDSWIDFGALSYINFPGWYFMKYPIDAKGVLSRRNQSLGGRWTGGQGQAVFPIKLTGLFVTLRRKALNPNTMTEVPGVIRIQKLGSIVNPEFQIPSK